MKEEDIKKDVTDHYGDISKGNSVLTQSMTRL
jgi:hypothetical protein